MIISVNWLKKFTDISLSTNELATLIGARLVEIETVENLTEKYKDVIVVNVVECEDVEGSDHLHLTKIDDGKIVKDVERDENGLVQVVCGAPNVHAGMLAAWLPPGSTVPESFGTQEPFILGARQLKGHVSNGMLASAKELDLFDDHEGIIEIDKDAAPGSSFAQLYELDDDLLDVENKSLTHRPDTFGIIGFAREVAAIQGNAFKTPEWLVNLAPSIDSDATITAPLVSIDDEDISMRYQAIVLSGANEATVSPLEIQTFLSRSGVRPINAIVDVTNYLMLLTGQPLHAFDYDKVLKVSDGKAEIHVRKARDGETLTLLDGRTIELSTEDIVIAAGETPVALAGAMGGSETEIDHTTKNIILESATFNLYNLRSTQMRHGIFSEAVTRFTKGQPAELTAPVLSEAVKMLGELTGARPVSETAEAYPGKKDPVTLTLTSDVVNGLLGSGYSGEAIVKTLQNVEFEAVVEANEIKVTAPYWRSDIHIVEDIIEEVGRINSYDSITPMLPGRDFTAVLPAAYDQLRATVRSLLVSAGANEVLTYSFVHGDMMKKANQDPAGAYRITNSISPDLQYYRQSISPSLIANVHANIKAGYSHFALFEMNKFHVKKTGMTEEGVPKELDSVAFVITKSKAEPSAPYYEAKAYVDYLADKLHLDLVYEPLEDDNDYPVTLPFEPKRSARVWDRKTRERVGVVGEYRRSVAKAFKLPDYTAGFEVSTIALLRLTSDRPSFYAPSSKFPKVERDICFKVDEAVTYQAVVDAVQSVFDISPLEASLLPVDLYQAEAENTKNITVRLTFTSFEKTLTGDEATNFTEQVVNSVVSATGAVVV